MKINSSSYDLASIFNALAAQKTAATTTDSDETQSAAEQSIGSLMQRLAPPDLGGSFMSLSASGQKVKNSIQPPDPPSEEMKAAMDALRSQFDTLKETDVEALSEEEAREMLSTLVSSLSALPASSSASGTGATVDVSTLSDSEVSDLLEGIQSQVAAGRPQGSPPPPPPGGMKGGAAGGLDLSSLLGTTEEDEEDTADISTEAAQRLVDLLTQDYDSTEESSSEYAARMKTAIEELLEKQKASMNTFANELYTQLDAWSTAE